jgi:hypothetical protein
MSNIPQGTYSSKYAYFCKMEEVKKLPTEISVTLLSTFNENLFSDKHKACNFSNMSLQDFMQ